MKKLTFMLCLVSTSVFAQQQTPNEQALAQKLMQEIGVGVQCSSQLIALRQDLEKANAEIKRLVDKEKPEPKK